MAATEVGYWVNREVNGKRRCEIPLSRDAHFQVKHTIAS